MLKLMPPVFSNCHEIGQVPVKSSAREWLTDFVFLDLVDRPSVLVFLVQEDGLHRLSQCHV